MWFGLRQVSTEEEMTRILPLAKKHQVPVTFRASGTSLSGQAITDSVLLKINHQGKHFRGYSVNVCPVPCPSPLPSRPGHRCCCHPSTALVP